MLSASRVFVTFLFGTSMKKTGGKGISFINLPLHIKVIGEMKYTRGTAGYTWDRLQNKITHCKGIRNNTGSRQTTVILELKVLRPATSTHVSLGFPVSISKRSDGSQHSKLPLHASHVALRT